MPNVSLSLKSKFYQRVANLIRALNTIPGTVADDIGCLIAIASLGAAAYAMLVLA